jgi:restriction system protein
MAHSDDSTRDVRAWLVRAGRRGEQERMALDTGRAAVGWPSVGDLSNCRTRHDVLEILLESTPEASDRTLANHATQLWAFVAKMQNGDLVVLPLKLEKVVAIGRITGPYRYAAANSPTARHTRPVTWIRTDLPRTAIGPDLLSSLNAYTTVCELRRNGAAGRFSTMAEAGSDPGRPAGEGDHIIGFGRTRDGNHGADDHA